MTDSTPPASQQERELLLSAYMDGELDASEREQVAAWIESNAAFRQEYLNLQALSASVSQCLPLPDGPSGDLWQNIAAKLQATPAPSDAFDEEFISAYYDNEIPRQAPELEQFEAQLFGNTEHNELLADIGDISEAIRNFAYRLEEACSFDLAPAVMAAYQAEQAFLEESTVLDPVLVEISAYADSELPAKDVIGLNKQLEAHPDYRDLLSRFTLLSEAIHAMAERQAEAAPDLWDAVQAKLTEDNVVSLEKRRTRMPKVWPVSAAAAVLLVTVCLPLAKNPMQEVARISASRESAEMSAGGAIAENKIAALPASAKPQAMLQPVSADVSPAESAYTSEKTKVATAAPAVMTQSLGALGERSDVLPGEAISAKRARRSMKKEAVADDDISAMPPPAAPAASTKPGGSAIPSSEDFLIDSLRSEMTESEVQVILGL